MKQAVLRSLTECILTVLAACNASGRLLGRHGANVLSTAWSPDNRHVVSSAWDSTVRIWDRMQGSTGVVLHPGSPPTYQVRWSSTEDRLSMVTESSVQFWDTKTDSATRVIPLEPNNGTWMRVVWSHDGHRAVVFGWADGSLSIQHADEVGRAIVLRGHMGGQVATADWSPDDRLLVSGGAVGDSTARLWDTRTGRQVQVISTGTGNWIAVAWSPAGSRLAWHGYSDDALHIGSVFPYRETAVLKHPAPIEHAVWSPDGQQVVTIDRHGALRLWNAASGALVRATPAVGDLVDVSLDAGWSAATPNIAAVRDGKIVIWNVLHGDLQEQYLPFPVVSLAWSPDGRWLAAGGYDGSVSVLEPTR